MRVLFDESMPRPFARDIIGHEVQTVREMRWTGTRNGELLRRAVAAGFDALVTMDRSLQYQQNLRTLELGIVVVRAPSNRLEALQHHWLAKLLPPWSISIGDKLFRSANYLSKDNDRAKRDRSRDECIRAT